MEWIEVLAVFVMSHLTGDYLLQTEFQATNKHGGLGPDPVRRRALALHALSYTSAYIPALYWLSTEIEPWAVAVTALAIGVPHGIQDDGRLMRVWMQRVKHTAFMPGPLSMCVDQTFHLLALFATALIVAS